MKFINKDLVINLKKKIDQREFLINKFIEKFPKVKLQTIIEINKYYNNIDIIDNDIIMDKNMYQYLIKNNLL